MNREHHRPPTPIPHLFMPASFALPHRSNPSKYSRRTGWERPAAPAGREADHEGRVGLARLDRSGANTSTPSETLRAVGIIERECRFNGPGKKNHPSHGSGLAWSRLHAHHSSDWLVVSAG